MFLCADLVDYKHQLSVQFVYKHFPTLSIKYSKVLRSKTDIAIKKVNVNQRSSFVQT